MNIERIKCTRQEFAERFGRQPDVDSMGVCIVSPDRRNVLMEFVFTDAVFPPNHVQVDDLERIYKL